MKVAKVECIRQETPTVKSFRLRLFDGSCSFLPGQWVDVYLPPVAGDPEIVVGGFSITSSPLHDDYIEIAVKKLPHGRASVHMHEHIEVGDTVMFDGGYGDFCYSAGTGDTLLLLAGGIGITPLMSIMRFIDEAELDVTAMLCYGAKTPSELVFREELEAMASRRTNLSCQFTVTDPGVEAWSGPTGRIDMRLLSRSCNAQIDCCYVCGPRGFVTDMKRLLGALSVDPSSVKEETW